MNRTLKITVEDLRSLRVRAREARTETAFCDLALAWAEHHARPPRTGGHLRLAAPIVPQTQPTPVSCTATCVAMAVGVPVAQLGVPLDNALNTEDFGVWLAERGIWLRPGIRINPWGEDFKPGRLYLVGARSRNTIGGDHALLFDTRGADPFNGKLYDPNVGIAGKELYHWISELSVVYFHELVERGTPGYIALGASL